MVAPASNPFAVPAARWPFLVSAAGLLAALLLIVYVLLPLAAERLILPRLFEAAGIQDYAVTVRQLGLFGMNAGPVRIGPEAAPGLSVASLSVRYRPLDLLRGRMDRITLAGVRVLVQEGAQGGMMIPGLPLPAAPREDRAEVARRPPPMAVTAIHVSQGTIFIQRKNRFFRLPFEVVLTPEADMAAFVAALALELDDQYVALDAEIDLAANRIAMDWKADDIRAGWLSRLAGLPQPPFITGSGGLRGRLQGRLSPFAIDDLEATFRHTPCRLYWDAGRLDLSGETNREDIKVQLRSTGIAQWHIETSPLRVRLPRGGDGRFTLAGTLTKTAEGSLAWQGRLNALCAADPVREDLPGMIMPLALITEGRLEADGHWQASAQQAPADTPSKSPLDKPEQGAIRLEPMLLEVSARGGGGALTLDLDWRFTDVAAAGAGLQVAVGAAQGSGYYRVQDNAGEGHLALSMAPIRVNSSRFKSGLKRVYLEVDSRTGPEAPLKLTGHIAFSGGETRLSKPAIAAGGFSARLPLAWPPPAKAPPGAFSVAAINWEGRSLGAVEGRLQQTDRGIRFSARHANRLVPGFKVTAEGAAGLVAGSWRPFAKVSWAAERSSGEPPLTLSALMPNPPEFSITFDGQLYAQGAMAYQEGLVGSLTAGMRAGRLQVDERGFVIDGIETAMHIPDIRHLRSAPAQRLAFETASFGTLQAQDGQLGFQLEPDGVLFLEGGRFRWCGGSVIAPATRFRPGENRYTLTVLCDRLKLDMLLEQLGMARAEGGGAISGLIPVALEDGLVTFNDAFLYSTPGESGVIRVQGSEVLTAGIPPGTPQYNQMELARYALKDYDYDWAKITMNTVAEDLLVQLQFDGKPAEPLPFVYDPAAGGFVKTDPGQPGSVFQGIRLDVNVTLPLNRMLRYRELFKRLQ